MPADVAARIATHRHAVAQALEKGGEGIDAMETRRVAL